MDAEKVHTSLGEECRWTNGTKGVTMPPSPMEYCDYIASGYFGYLWPKAQGSFDCPATSVNSATDDSFFCVWTDGQKGVTIPKAAIADCGKVSKGEIGFVFSPAVEILL